jgi:2-haloacid dehalogenase
MKERCNAPPSLLTRTRSNDRKPSVVVFDINETFRLVTLMNSPPNLCGKSPLEHACLAGHFERQFSVEALRVFKPSPLVYCMVTEELGVAPSACCMVASHDWDTIGAQSVGFSAGLITRAGNAPLPVSGLPQPAVVAPDLPTLAARLNELWRS